MRRQLDDAGRNALTYSLGASTASSQSEKHQVASAALNKSANGAGWSPQQQVTFPMPGDSAVGCFGWPLADHDWVGDLERSRPPDLVFGPAITSVSAEELG